jgi:prefoldin subunit 5
MDVRTFEGIKNKIEVIRNKIESLKSKKAKAEGAMETIEASWRKNFDIGTLAEAEDLVQVVQEKMEKTSSAILDIQEELNGLTNWASI